MLESALVVNLLWITVGKERREDVRREWEFEGWGLFKMGDSWRTIRLLSTIITQRDSFLPTVVI